MNKIIIPKRAILFCILLTLLVCKIYLKPGIPQTHDGTNHLARFANYKLAVKEGQLPPRLAPNLMNRYTYPVFNYNYPLANLLSLPFSALKTPYETTFKLITMVFLAIGGVGMYRLNTNYLIQNAKKGSISNKPSRISLLFGLGIYYSTIYLFNLVVVRGNIGELMAYGLFPWMLDSIITQPKFGFKQLLLWTCWWLTHNIFSIFVWPILLLFGLLHHGFNFKIWKKYLALGVISLCLSLWFWLPALAELKLVAAGHSSIVSESANHLLSLKQLLFGSPQFGYSRLGNADDMSFGLGTVQLVMLIILAGLLIAKRRSWEKIRSVNKNVVVILALVTVLILLQLDGAQYLWVHLKPLQLMQFPWRLSFFITPFLSLLAVCVWQNIKQKRLKIILLGVLILQILSYSKIMPIGYDHFPNSYYDAFPESTTTSNENKPESFKYLLIGDWQPAPFIVDGEGTSDVAFWNGSKHIYSLELSSPAIIIEPVMQFAGWQTKVNGKIIEYYDSDDIQGRLAFKLPLGKYEVETKFTQNTWPRILGNWISLLTGLVVMAYFLRQKKTHEE